MPLLAPFALAFAASSATPIPAPGSDTPVLHDWTTWTWTQRALFCATILASYDIMEWLVSRAFAGSKQLPMTKGKHLDQFSAKDVWFIAFNRLTGLAFVYHCLQYWCLSARVPWALGELSLANTVLALPMLFIFYDFFYCLWHRLLHVRAIYGFVHKHHHRQVVPTRGNYDAMNVHPLEFIVGEYLHLLAMAAVPAHVTTYGFFFLLLGVLTGLNHTRCDITLPGLFSVRWHDLHHRIPQVNYGQYTMVWDILWGSFRTDA